MILSKLLKAQSSYRWKILLPAALSAGVALLAGCNDTLRQFIVPVPKPGGDQTGTAHAIILSTNPVGQGSDMHIDVSGDTIAGIVNIGNNPVFLGKTSGRAWVINGDNTITTYIALLPLTSAINTVVLPATDSGAVAGGTSSGGNFYTANNGSNNTDQVSSAVLAVTQTIPVGTNPVAVAGNSANSKIYIVNHGTNNVTVLSTTDNTIVPPPIPVGFNPIWAVMSADGVDVFVVNQGDGTATHPGSVSVIDTTLDIVIATINVGNFPATSQPNFAYFDTNRQRVYVTNTGENTVSVIKADGINLGVTPQVLPVLLKNITVSGAPISVAALNDGSKVYAALGNCPAGTNHTNLVLPTPTTGNLANCNGNLLSVIDATALAETSTLNVGSGAVSVDVDANATRVYAVAAHAAQVAIIRPTTNSITTTFPAPQQNLSCAVPTNCPANATQTPFMVRVFP
jgi:DNA-binding beta-propeller fold protein YncE